MKLFKKYYYIYFKQLYQHQITAWRVIYIKNGIRSVKSFLNKIKTKNVGTYRYIQIEDNKPEPSDYLSEVIGSIYDCKLYETLDDFLKVHFTDLL